MKDVQTEIHNHAEDICRLNMTLDNLQKTMDIRNQAQEKSMEEIKVVLQQLLLNSSNTHGSSSHSSSPVQVSPLTMVVASRDISLGFPHYDGSSSILDWIFKADKFFNYHHTLDGERVEIVSMHFEKEVVSWFQMPQKMNVVQTWPTLTRALESQFGPSPFDSPMATV